MNEKQYDWAFGLQWLAACAVGVVIFGMAGFFSIWTVGGVVEDLFGGTAGILASGAMFGALFALGASIGTGLLLQGKGVDARRWIAGSLIAGSLGSAPGWVLILTILDAETMADNLAGLMMGLTLGVSIGFGQWLVLRESSTAAYAWPAITTVAFLLALMIGLPLGDEANEWISLGTTGLLVGAVTALGMVWMLGRQTTAVA